MKIFKIKKKVKKYDYLISYHHKCGVGSLLITLTRQLETFKDIDEIKRTLENENNILENVGIISYQLVGIRKVKEEK